MNSPKQYDSLGEKDVSSEVYMSLCLAGYDSEISVVEKMVYYHSEDMEERRTEEE
jgi:hypothetical protein